MLRFLRHLKVSNTMTQCNSEAATICRVMGWDVASHHLAASHLINEVGYSIALAYARLGVRFIYQMQELHELGVDPSDVAALNAQGSVVADYLQGRIPVDHITMALTTLYTYHHEGELK